MNDGGPAFPIPDVAHPNGQIQFGANGMTLRDWFAGQALAGMASNGSYDQMTWEEQARAAYGAADAMLMAREGGSR